MTDEALPYDRRPEFKALDEAIRGWHAQDGTNEEWMLTGWTVLTSAMRVANLADHTTDSYISRALSSSGQSYHHTLGLVADVHDDMLHPGKWESE